MSNIKPARDGILTGRKLELFHAPSLPEWGYTEEQVDTFAVLHPADECLAGDDAGKKYPLYVVFHSAGHDVYTTIATVWQPGNHDIYHAPREMFAVYLDCRQHEDKDWWWGGNSALEVLGEDRRGTKQQPVENRAIATIKWVMENYPIDKNRVYAVGNSMGGSGALGIAMCRGDIFAAVKVNVPAGVRHMADRCALDTEATEGFRIPEPPVLVDYSAQDDEWSTGHQILYKGMREKKYALLGFWGKFGHANNHEYIKTVNDMIHAFDPFSLRLDEAYPVFTNATSDDKLPWGEDGTVLHEEAGQVNGFFRWGKVEETEKSASVALRLLTPAEWESRVTFPTSSTADVTVRRLQKCRFTAGTSVAWEFGEKSGVVTADENGLVTVPGITVTADEAVLKLTAE
ncbi:MAG: hypothetical protein E7638_00335 [Ruminococcaceae bacterium]|nr:hypothetical protein [Oscillospiraceae bacterium]